MFNKDCKPYIPIIMIGGIFIAMISGLLLGQWNRDRKPIKWKCDNLTKEYLAFNEKKQCEELWNAKR